MPQVPAGRYCAECAEDLGGWSVRHHVEDGDALVCSETCFVAWLTARELAGLAVGSWRNDNWARIPRATGQQPEWAQLARRS